MKSDPPGHINERRIMPGALTRFFIIATHAVLLFLSLCGESFSQLPQELSLSCTTTSVGRIPINDLGSGVYEGYPGGLYPGGLNQRPPVHDAAGRAMAEQVLPRDVAGNVDMLNGRVVLLSIGMSNTTQEFSVFREIANADSVKNPKLVIVDGAQGGQTAAIISDSNANFWSVIDQRLFTAGVTRPQVQAAWVKEANASPMQAFPRHAQILDSQFVLIARILKARYPNIRLAYWSSRTYGGYANTALNPEPYAYESGFAVKWVIEKQINGDTSLTYSGSDARAPWLSWGPYLWADGLVPRSDSLIWLCSDFQADGTHPSNAGRLKVAQMLLRFFKTDSTTVGWFLHAPVASSGSENNLEPDAYSLEQNFPNPFNPTTTIRFNLSESGHTSLKVYDLLGNEVAVLVHGNLARGEHTLHFDAANLSSGMYIYRLLINGFSQARKFIILR
ncbi:MAG: T9SS type A sorting domain-containing protein [Ignavibacteriae bacterium]|nr:T9SS type A sorting domain-containing protein [Ignavibacteriota bacterium]